MKPVVRVVGLGPGTLDHVTLRTQSLLTSSPVVRLRTREHPSAASFGDLESYDEFYESASSFDDLYSAIVDDLVALALGSPTGEVVYAVPGSPTVAERTVELLRERHDVTTISEPAVSVIDVVCAALGRDPMGAGLRVVDALGSADEFRGPGPLLILQTYSPEVLASVADRLPPTSDVVVLHHLGLDSEEVVTLRASALASFHRADHLTSLWVEGFRDAGVAIGDLVAFMKRLRAECPWDQEQTHASLTRHLLEEAYETIDALETFVRVEADGLDDERAVLHVEEELGDLLFQIVFHAELGDEEGNFNFATIADAVRDKLIGRHPHVFGDVTVTDSNDVATRWERLKQKEKGRESITDGIAWQLPALTLYTKLLRKAVLVDVGVQSGEASREIALRAMNALELNDVSVRDAQSASDVDCAWGDALSALVAAAQFAGVDLEGVLRERAAQLRDAIQAVERSSK
ncbi:MAG TPA: MazG family protein [Acidimicrobiales bacterium]|nr:MazG family protein [Acidimicrobiales bacterium]